jgi:hypothetical protein
MTFIHGTHAVIRKLKFGLCIGVVVLAAMAGWQIGSSELANVELLDDLHDMASKLDTRIGFSAPKSDDDYRNEVIRRADQHGIVLQPREVMVERHGSGESETISLAVDYKVPVRVPGFAFALHFTPRSERG